MIATSELSTIQESPLVRHQKDSELRGRSSIRRLRSYSPDSSISTRIVHLDDSIVVVRAEVEGSEIGRVSAHGSYRFQESDFAIEKAESRAISRAVSNAVTGIDKSDSPKPHGDQKPVGSRPYAVRSGKQRYASAKAKVYSPVTPLAQPATDRQLNFIGALFRELGMNQTAMRLEIERVLGQGKSEEIDRRDASKLIDHLQRQIGMTAVAS